MDQARDKLLYGRTPGDRNPFKDARVRRALYQAIDIETLKVRLMSGQSMPTGAVVPSPIGSLNDPAIEKRLPYDLTEARRLMAEAGCVEILIGLESPVEAGLSRLELHSDWKKKRYPEYREAIRKIQSHGIRMNGCFIVGLDGHTPAIFDAIYKFVEQTQLFDVQITYPTPFPGTPMYRQLKLQDRLLYDRDWRRMTLFDVTFMPDPMSPEELAQGFRDLGLRLYSEDFTKFRHQTFKEKYLRGSRHALALENQT